MSASRQLNNFESIEQSYYQAQGAFVGAITQGTPANPSLEDGLKAHLLAGKATQSLKNLIAHRMAWILADRLQQSNKAGLDSNQRRHDVSRFTVRIGPRKIRV